MSSEELVKEAFEKLQELEQDNDLPKNIRLKIRKIMDILKENEESSIKKNSTLPISALPSPQPLAYGSWNPFLRAKPRQNWVAPTWDQMDRRSKRRCWTS